MRSSPKSLQRIASPPRHAPYRGRVTRRPSNGSGALPPPTSPYEETWEQSFRIEDTTLVIYELYAGVNAAPDFTTPVATSATLPFSWTPTLPPGGNALVNCVVRVVDRYSLQSFNLYQTVVKFVSGAGVLLPPTPPVLVRVQDAQAGFIRVLAKYIDTGDEPNPADTWVVYVKIGADPVPGTDPITYQTLMLFGGPESGLTVVLGPYTPGTVAHVLVGALRSSDSQVGFAPVVDWTLAVQLTLPEAFMFGGDTYLQE